MKLASSLQLRLYLSDMHEGLTNLVWLGIDACSELQRVSPEKVTANESDLTLSLEKVTVNISVYIYDTDQYQCRILLTSTA